ncbi:MAG: TIR domain-containing protein [Saprospiraceae bacterium]|nr:TIR domain-containing protein [Saprospiraceae bacterium]MDZ4704479.1 TIR domain-containing protein [Saprospiraceae bacterium]
MVNIFIHYNNSSSKDAEFFKEIEKRLIILRNKQVIATYWHTALIEAGDDIDAVIQQQLGQAQIVLLLISSDYFSDDDCKNRHAFILKRKVQDALCIVPILLRPVEIDGTDIIGFSALPKAGKGEKFLSKWPDPDEAYLHIELELKRLATEVLSQKSNSHREILLRNALLRFNFSKEIPSYIAYSSNERKVYAVLLQGEPQSSQSLLLQRLFGESKSKNPKVISIKLDSAGHSSSLDQLWTMVGENFNMAIPDATLVCSELRNAMIRDTEIVIRFDPVERYHLKEVQAFWTELLRQLSPHKDYWKKPLHFYVVDRNAAKEWNADQLCCDPLLSSGDVLHLQIAKITKPEFIHWLFAEKNAWSDDPQLAKIWQNRDQIMPLEEGYVGDVVGKICEICEITPTIIH